MRTRAGLFSRRSKLDWEIRFGPKNGVTMEKILAMEEERKSVVEKRSEIEAAKDPTQRRLERPRKAITGKATIISKEDDVKWGTRTLVPSANEE